ncbi:MAG: P-II family nitrogen regulator [Nitrospirota bacterium]
MIRAVIRPEREAEVLGRLEAAGFYAMTKTPVLGRGEQRGIQVGAVSYDELAKLMLILVVDEADLSRAARAIEEGARTGHHGDGKIFVQKVRESYTIRSGTRD